MLLLLPLSVALGLTLLRGRGGTLRALGALPLRGLPWIALALGLQLLLYLPGLRASALAAQWGPALYVGSMGCAVAGALRNWHLGGGLRLLALGLGLNTAVILANGGSMPVDAGAVRLMQGAARVQELAAGHLYNNTHLATRATRLAPLSDVLPLGLPGGAGNVYSLGDVLIAAGGGLLVYRWSGAGVGAGTRRPARAL